VAYAWNFKVSWYSEIHIPNSNALLLFSMR
jgi:hypothetical protein